MLWLSDGRPWPNILSTWHTWSSIYGPVPTEKTLQGTTITRGIHVHITTPHNDVPFKVYGRRGMLVLELCLFLFYHQYDLATSSDFHAHDRARRRTLAVPRSLLPTAVLGSGRRAVESSPSQNIRRGHPPSSRSSRRAPAQSSKGSSPTPDAAPRTPNSSRCSFADLRRKAERLASGRT